MTTLDAAPASARASPSALATRSAKRSAPSLVRVSAGAARAIEFGRGGVGHLPAAGLFAGLGEGVRVTRYHSLVVRDLPTKLDPTTGRPDERYVGALIQNVQEGALNAAIADLRVCSPRERG